jgi:predicted RNA-binding protein with PUA-like domain
MANYWLIKSEPFKYSWDDLVRDGKTYWDGVRNAQARNNLQAMKRGDLCLYYHSNEGKEVVGIAGVVKQAYPDPTTDDPRWVVVDVAPRKPLLRPVSLATLRTEEATAGMAVVRQSRLSVCPVEASEFRAVLKLGGTTL